jgi:hypothetical protein
VDGGESVVAVVLVGGALVGLARVVGTGTALDGGTSGGLFLLPAWVRLAAMAIAPTKSASTTRAETQRRDKNPPGAC